MRTLLLLILALPAAGQAAAGDVIVHYDWLGDVRRFRTDGTPVDAFHIGAPDTGTPLAGDLGLDQCTLYSVDDDTPTAPSRLRRFDFCHCIQLPDLGNADYCYGFAGDGPRAAVRVGADGSVLVADCHEVRRFAGNGVQNYGMEKSAAIAPTADGRFFWTSDSNYQQLLLVDAASGEVVRRTDIAPQASADVSAIEIAGAPRASLAATSEIPALSPAMLAVLAIVLAAIAMRVQAS